MITACRRRAREPVVAVPAEDRDRPPVHRLRDVGELAADLAGRVRARRDVPDDDDQVRARRRDRVGERARNGAAVRERVLLHVLRQRDQRRVVGEQANDADLHAVALEMVHGATPGARLPVAFIVQFAPSGW